MVQPNMDELYFQKRQLWKKRVCVNSYKWESFLCTWRFLFLDEYIRSSLVTPLEKNLTKILAFIYVINYQFYFLH